MSEPPTEQMTERMATERMATTVLRVMHHDGVLATAPRLDVCLRAALFADLILAGRAGTHRGSPVALDHADGDYADADYSEADGDYANDGADDGADYADEEAGTDDRMLAAIENAIARRRRVQWWRWYRHVEGDRAAMVRELVAAGRWEMDPATGRPRDREADLTAALAADLAPVRRRRRGPAGPHEATLAYLCELATTARAGDLLEAWSPVLVRALGDDPARPALTDALSAASTVRRGRFTRSLRR